MLFSDDMKELIQLMNRHGVQYAMVGGFAVNYHGYVRTTQDIDFLVYPSEENAVRMMAALTEFGFGNAGIPQEYFARKGTVVHIGVEPNRIDFLTHLAGVDNEVIFSNLEDVVIDDVSTKMISFQDLISAKKKSKRLKDLADAEELEKISR
jgi:predicted nucleotidyltransferase